MNAYDANRAWSDRFLPHIKAVVGQRLLEASPDPLDWHAATDLMMLDARDLRIAARVRRHGYARQFPFDFAIRSRLPSGAPTELGKIVNGHGDWMFYGHSNAAGTGLDAWWLIDLRAFRAGLIRKTRNGYPIRCGDKKNRDGTFFKWFDVRSFPSDPPLVVASGLS